MMSLNIIFFLTATSCCVATSVADKPDTPPPSGIFQKVLPLPSCKSVVAANSFIACGIMESFWFFIKGYCVSTKYLSDNVGAYMACMANHHLPNPLKYYFLSSLNGIKEPADGVSNPACNLAFSQLDPDVVNTCPSFILLSNTVVQHFSSKINKKDFQCPPCGREVPGNTFIFCSLLEAVYIFMRSLYTISTFVGIDINHFMNCIAEKFPSPWRQPFLSMVHGISKGANSYSFSIRPVKLTEIYIKKKCPAAILQLNSILSKIFVQE